MQTSTICAVDHSGDDKGSTHQGWPSSRAPLPHPAPPPHQRQFVSSYTQHWNCYLLSSLLPQGYEKKDEEKEVGEDDKEVGEEKKELGK